MKNILYKAGVAVLLLSTLTGCLFPQNELDKNKIPNESQLKMVEDAVLEYMDETDGLIPIKTKPNDVSLYEKYLIDFSTLKERQLLSDIPGTAYENGGVYQYTIVTPEEDPRVKLIDLRITEEVRSVYVKLNTYRTKHTYPPFGEEVSDGLYTINYEKLGIKKEPSIVSPYSQTTLPLLMNVEGDLFVDYRIDLNKALEEFDHSFEEGDDIRSILVDHYPFVPVYSLPYTIEDGEPTFLENKE